MIQKVFCDYSCYVVMTPKNITFLKQFMDFCFENIENGFDQNTKRIVWTILRSMLASLNGVKLQNLKLTGLRLKKESPFSTIDCTL